MNLLDDLMIEAKYADLENLAETIITNFASKLDEGVTDIPGAWKNLDGSYANPAEVFDEVVKRLEAAKRAIGLANKLKDPQQRKENRSRIMGNLNRINALLNRLAKMASAPDEQ